MKTPRDEVMSIIRDICFCYGITEDEIFHRRYDPVVAARWEAFTVLSNKGWNTARIARLFKVHPSTVAHGLRKGRPSARSRQSYLQFVLSRRNKVAGHEPPPSSQRS
jgi:hypothetical protein